MTNKYIWCIHSITPSQSIREGTTNRLALKIMRRETLGENVHYLRLSRNKMNLKMLASNYIMNKMIINLYMFATIIQSKIGGMIGGRNIIAKQMDKNRNQHN